MPNYKSAFKCKKCPKSSKEDGCPAWNEIIMTNAQTGEQRIEAGCFYQILPALIVESIRSSAVATNTQASVKNEIARGFATMSRAMPGFVAALAQTVGKENENEVEVLTAKVDN